MLTPVPNDITVHLIDRILGSGWASFAHGVAPSGPGLLIAQLLGVLNASLLAVVSAVVIWQAVTASVSTAHEGTPLGKGQHTVWTPVRQVSSYLMLTPLPWAHGFSLIQVIIMMMVSWSIGISDDLWSTYLKWIPAHGGMVVVAPPSATTTKTAGELLRTLTIQAYLRNEMGYRGAINGTKVWKGMLGTNISGHWLIAFNTGNRWIPSTQIG